MTGDTVHHHLYFVGADTVGMLVVGMEEMLGLVTAVAVGVVVAAGAAAHQGIAGVGEGIVVGENASVLLMCVIGHT